MVLFDYFQKNVENHPNHPAVMFRDKGTIHSLSWKDVNGIIRNYCYNLKRMGIKKGDRVLIYGNTSKEWGFLDMAIMAIGGVTVPVYHSSHKDEVEYILNHAKSKFLFVENRRLLEKAKKTNYGDKFKTTLIMNQLYEDGSSEDNGQQWLPLNDSQDGFKTLSINSSPEDLATIIYTSGTSGVPKGVKISHRQIISSVSDAHKVMGVTYKDRSLTFLPFSHVLGRQELWGHYYSGLTLGYAESIDRLKKNLPQFEPTLFVGVPRIFEKIYFGILAQITISKTKKQLFDKSVLIGRKIVAHQNNKTTPPLLLALQYQMAKKLVFNRISSRLGGNLRFAVSGGAPLDKNISQFFMACGLPILEGYGLTETTGPIFVNTLYNNRLGSVGQPLPEVSFKVAKDGEILIKSQKVMLGYERNAAATKKAINSEGFLKTGDIGHIDDQGYLTITDRKKDLIKTAGGKFVAPQKIQKLFSTHPIIQCVHVHGDKRKYIVALLTLDFEELLNLKKSQNIRDSSIKELLQNAQVRNHIHNVVSQVNQKLASFETLKKYKILNHEFTIDGGQLTPSLKMKRNRIDQIYQADIDGLYH